MAKVFENQIIKTLVTFSGNISSLTTFPVVTVTECETLIIWNILKHFSFAHISGRRIIVDYHGLVFWSEESV